MSSNQTNLYSTLTPSGLYTRKEIADYIGVSERTISNMMRTRRIPVIRIGGNVRFDPVKVRKALEKYEIEAIWTVTKKVETLERIDPKLESNLYDNTNKWFQKKKLENDQL